MSIYNKKYLPSKQKPDLIQDLNLINTKSEYLVLGNLKIPDFCLEHFLLMATKLVIFLVFCALTFSHSSSDQTELNKLFLLSLVGTNFGHSRFGGVTGFFVFSQ